MKLLSRGVGSERTGVGSHRTGVGSGRAVNNTNITIITEQEIDIATNHPSSHHDKDNNARARSSKCLPVDSVDNTDGGESIQLQKKSDSTIHNPQIIKSLLNSAGFEGSQVEVEFVGRWACFFPLEMIEYALNKSVLNGKKNLYYVEGIIDSWLEKRIRTLEEARKETRYDKYIKSVKPFG